MNKHAVILFSLFLCACGGGGGAPDVYTGQTAFSPGTEQEVAGFSEVAARVVSLSQEVGGAPVFGVGGGQGSVMSSYTAGIADAVGFDTSFNGERFMLQVNRQDGSSSTADTDTAIYATGANLTPQQNPLSNRDAVQAYVLSTAGSTTTIVSTFVEWEDGDFTNYLAGGYWIHVDAEAPGVELGAFVDSPEYDQTITVPVSGMATYTGRAAGFYMGTYGTDSRLPEGTTFAGEYQGVVTMSANFDTGMVSGQVRDLDYTYHTTLTPDGRVEESRVPQRLGYMLDMAATPFDSAGQFSGTGVTLSHPRIVFAETGGTWAGRFSEVNDANGLPRGVAGVHRGSGRTPGGTTAVLVGAHYGSTEQYE